MSRQGFAILERRMLGGAMALLLCPWLIACVTDVNHPPGTRKVRVAAALFVVSCGALEIYRPWTAFVVFLLIWPHMLVFRELLSNYVSPLFTMLPAFWGGAMAAAIGIGVWLRNDWLAKLPREDQLDRSNRGRSGKDAWITFPRVALWVFTLSLVVSAAFALVRLSARPPGWLVQGTDVRHLLDMGIFSDLIPATIVVQFVPPLLLGVLLLNLFSDVHSRRAWDQAGQSFPTRRLAGWASLSGAVLALEVLSQLIYGWAWSFDKAQPSGGFANRNITAPLLAVFGALMFALGWSSRGLKRALWMAGAASMFATTVLEGSRNGVLGVVLFVGLALLIRTGWARATIVLGCLGLLLALTLWVPLPDPTKVGLPAAKRVVQTLAALRRGDWVEATSFRTGTYTAAWVIFQDNPILGSGPGTFPMQTSHTAHCSRYVLDSDGGVAVHTHSMPLQALVEGGLLAMLAWVAVFVVVPLLAVLFWPDRNCWAVPLALVGACNLFDAAWLSAGVSTFCILVLAMAYWEHMRPEANIANC